MLFLPFEVIAVLALVWSYASNISSKYTGIYIMLLLVFAMLLSIAGYKIIGDSDGE